MLSLSDITKLAQNQSGTVFVVGEDGSVKFVLMPAAEYEKLTTQHSPQTASPKKPSVDVEAINQLITTAQLKDQVIVPVKTVSVPAVAPIQTSEPVLVSVLGRGQLELMEEVIDPSFDFEGPKQPALDA